ncbi:transcriptional regulator, TetR family [Nitratireductor aquibiodomus]|uniref:Transcriptional regulator, TetR family n=1 Tax=Nitratireductor aquibiodomus TaxID=204799 RepID=A0A1H4LR11_9HYPH|nr:TetR/AcrR family transcriptional regulator [Nitratireductor aquibiodomus]SEB73123.1 transcriptional regulator, TetR family [Nitratireductor aquibiodomus]
MARLVAERSDVIPLLAEVFRRYGYDGASVARITEHTNLGKGSLYHFFPGGKEEMAAAVLADVRCWFENNIFVPLEEKDPETALASMFAAVEDYFDSGQRICLVGAFALEETRDRFASEVKIYFARWMEALRKALEGIGFDRDHAIRSANGIVAGIQGAIILARALGDTESFSVSLSQLKGMAMPSNALRLAT